MKNLMIFTDFLKESINSGEMPHRRYEEITKDQWREKKETLQCVSLTNDEIESIDEIYEFIRDVIYPKAERIKFWEFSQKDTQYLIEIRDLNIMITKYSPSMWLIFTNRNEDVEDEHFYIATSLKETIDLTAYLAGELFHIEWIKIR